jgi:hypothetical protein
MLKLVLAISLASLAIAFAAVFASGAEAKNSSDSSASQRPNAYWGT